MTRIGFSCPASSSISLIGNRELNGLRAPIWPRFAGISAESNVIELDREEEDAIPFALSFCERFERSHLLASSGEDGFVRVFDTRNWRKTAEAKVCEWIAHKNAIFDVCWLKGGMRILTASGDQTIKAWCAETKKCVGIMKGHSGSVKSISAHPSNPECFVSGSRDGSFKIWDLRQNFSFRDADPETHTLSIIELKNAHSTSKVKRKKKTACTSITSVLYLKDGFSIATGGAGDSVVKIWDTRFLKTPLTRGCNSNVKTRALHGISCLSQDLNGVHLAASCMDNSIYLYDVLHLDKGPQKIFTGCKMDSFYVKSRINPDATHILSGSTDGNAYVWQIHGSQSSPFKFPGHDGEITAVDWCPSGFGKFTTSSEDLTIRVWELKEGNHQPRSPITATRKRVTAFPYDESTLDATESSANVTSPAGFYTPEHLKRRKSEAFEEVHKSPEASSRYPSVLNPPSSKKTIRDYFLTAPSLLDSNRD